ncbi:MAG: transglycosylase domain-containing protein [Proteobacteria bacterium]|nr:transglycosylase domain-containing protein [Pseudomonadota bacterium]MBU4296743.1 transglycosylase domain-containing protein [Pseudomonadota bacterium]MCG2745943.1 transglycosylase domain-containing protein [Desulfobulbaceae bacterium]
MFKKILFIFAALTSLVVISAVAAFMWLVVYHPGEALKQENIEKSLARESPVFCRDGVTKIGVFFQDAHRQYVSYGQLPQDFVNALIAAEDHQFFQHHGIDLPGFARAMFVNIRAGRIVQGGSTITQQTAKNLFERKGRSIKAKLTELLFALRLEYHYSKQKILEFYANQFYVSGNGRGLGVAARYYFDKEPEQLDLVEAAFIAGSVKRPNYYNPFIKKDEAGAAEARRNAKVRTAYVLGQMYRLGMISVEMYQQALSREIPFKRGKMQFRLNTLMDLVKDGLDDPAVEAALLEYGIENVATSGVRIFTSIDNKLQDSNLFALQSELSQLDVKLLGYDRSFLQKRYAELPFGVGNTVSEGQFLVGRVQEIEKGQPVRVLVSFSPNDQGSDKLGIIDEQGLLPLLASLVQYKGQRWSTSSRKDLPLLLKELQVGDLVYLSARGQGADDGEYLFNLEKYPELQGASLVLQEGKILALAGGMDNYFYNRAVSAKRAMGSVVKPLLYAAAIQLGWNSLDPLNNERNMFIYQRNAYIPRPDHISPHKRVSMSWAGVHSENVASVWLLYHLCDRLSPAQFKDLLAGVGMARETNESYEHYTRRVRDKMGVLVNEDALQKTAFEMAVAASEVDLLFAGKQDEWQNLGLFHYSDRFEKELDDLTEDVKANERELRQQIINRSFIRYRNLQQRVLNEAGLLAETSGGYLVPGLYFQPVEAKDGAGWAGDSINAGDHFIYSEENPGSGWLPVSKADLQRLLADMTPDVAARFWGEVRIDNMLSLATLDLLQENFRKEYQKLSSQPGYGDDVLHNIRDFRVLTGLRYLIDLCRSMGVTSELEPVLSFPLGSNVMSLFELVRVYEALTSGISYNPEESANPGLALIDRIETTDGEVIYESQIIKKRVIDGKTAVAVSDILRNVVRFGTGRYANNIPLRSSDPAVEAQLAELQMTVPVLGKTGTANRFTNSSFAGVVPAVRSKRDGLIVDGANFAVAAYVGFDDNRPMVHSSTRIAGSSGALPIWTKVAQSIIFERDYAGSLDMADMAFSGSSEVPLFYPALGQIDAPVAINGGGLLVSDRSGVQDTSSVVTFGKFLSGGEIQLERYFLPYWRNSEKQ